MRQALQRAWLRRGPLALALWPLSLVFAALAGVRRAMYRRGLLHSAHPGIPVVVVGNVVAGGAGKTPVLLALVRHLRARGLAVGVVSRGHGRQGSDCREVGPRDEAAQVGDEPLLIARQCAVPVFVAPRRLDAVAALRQRHPGTQVVVSDDGLQHLALRRDLELVVFDDRGTGNGWRLPAGPLREAWPRPADFVLCTPGAARLGGFELRRRLAAEAVRADGTRRDLALLAREGGCDAVAGIAQPDRFFAMLRERGVPLVRTFALPDHHGYADDGPWADGARPLLCTEKDAVKLWRRLPQAWAVPLELEVDPAFWAALDARLSSIHGPQTA